MENMALSQENTLRNDVHTTYIVDLYVIQYTHKI